MKLTCASCQTKYTIADERVEGRRVRIRCKKCGEAFVVDGTAGGGEVCAPESSTEPTPAAETAMVRRGPDRRGAGADLFATTSADDAETSAPRLTGERKESSVLFSLATLAKTASPVPASNVTESSAMIDLRALCTPSAASETGASTARDEIASLSGGGAFSPLFTPPLVAFVEDSAAEPPAAPRRTFLGIGVAAVVAVLGVATFVGARHLTAPAATPSQPIAASTATSADHPTAPTLASSGTSSTPEPTSASTPVAAPATSALVVATRPTASAAVRTQAPPPDARPTATSLASPPTSPKCCPGETETTCQMRISVGASCTGTPSTATTTGAPPFDRAAATRALGVSLASCKRDDGPTGPGHVKVTFQPSGSASAVEVDPPYASTPVGACVAQRFRATTIPAFSGAPLTLGKTFTIL